MQEFLIMLKNVIVFIALAIPGFILVKTKILSPKASSVLSNVLIYVGMPFLIISNVITIEFSGELALSFLIILGFGVFMCASSFFLSKPFFLFENDIKKQGVARFGVSFPNNGFLGIPLCLAVFGNGPVLFYLLIFNLLNNAFLYIFGVYLVSGDKKYMKPKTALLNPVLIGFAFGLVLNFSRVNTVLPEVGSFTTYLSNMVTPLSMIILGMKLGEIKLKGLFTSKKMYYLSFIKLIVFPIIFVAVAFLFRAIGFMTNDMLRAVFIAIAMPTAGMATAFAVQYNGDSESAVVYTLGTTCLSTLTIPLCYLLFVLLL